MQIPRRQLVLGGTGILIAAAAGNAEKPAAAAAAASAESLVQPPASVLVIGAGGATGGRIVRELLKRGYKVKAGVRDVEKGKAKLGAADGLSFVKTDVTEPESVIAQAIGDAEAVIVATGKASLNPADSWAVDNLGTQKAVDAAKKKGVKKFVLVSSILTNGAAIGQFFNPAYLVLNIIGGGVLFAKLKAEEHIKKAGVDYTVVRPGGLSNEPPAGSVVMGSEDTLFGGRISRDLVALVAVEALVSKNASKKVVEVIESPDAPLKSFEDMFAACKNAS
ncbi:NAD(P)-binding Rossmann-fold superfamily protein [Klebsormidium nitens]|uniref:NAD(P)-binding Rossmann-fold superfamily protein n=1 Tax=Klebsormidium nitens TaxID=105231 RepID=A0A1Y1I6Z2_KLENI|nr:NAD(P)-binding Rossmann-fold superfamily protein [Klebsormidium nitens]|eukprot:GAQ85199.1 NAD(P)-binding Rossmann-fold superfamily protein [Klebsormidium nitens]